MASYLITGSSRGLGLSLVNILAARSVDQVRFIAATARKITPALQTLVNKHPGRVVFVSLETTQQESVDAAVREVEKALGGKGLDCLINNAGISGYTPGGVANMPTLVSTFEVNVNGVQLPTAAFLPLLRKGSRKLVVNIGTTMASITSASKYTYQPTPAYKISKAAMNMLTVQWALEFENEGFTFFSVSPGWLKTDLGTDAADLPVDVGAKCVLEVVDTASTKDNGKFYDIKYPELQQYPGGEIPW